MTPAELRRIAEAATPGPWELDKCDNRVHVDYVRAPNDENLIAPICSVSSPGPNAEFIATFNPSKVLELLARLAEHEQAVENMSTKTDDLLSKLAAVEKLHPNIHGECHTCSNENGPLNWPCPTIKAARGE